MPASMELLRNELRSNGAGRFTTFILAQSTPVFLAIRYNATWAQVPEAAPIFCALPMS